MSYEIIEMNYSTGLWNEAMVRVAVRKGIITKEQFKEITDKEY